jgi:hypothetical protein
LEWQPGLSAHTDIKRDFGTLANHWADPHRFIAQINQLRFYQRRRDIELRIKQSALTLMPDRRAIIRHSTAGTISFNRDGGISCTVGNLSDTGACLEVISPLGIPDDFTLVMEDDHRRRSCHVAWRAPNRIGVEFK